MTNSQTKIKNQIASLPDTPGVYFFRRGNQILYIGKATSLADRVRSYFSKDILLTRGPRIEKMIEEADQVDFITTDSVLEALILEANEIRKHQPIYNAREKDDKSYNFVIITKEEFPRIIIERGKNLDTMEEKALKVFGPFPHAGELRSALKIVRKIFPYRDDKCRLVGKPCFNAQIGLCPGPCVGLISKTEYRKIIKHIMLFFEAKKPRLVESLEKEMSRLAKNQNFEEADKIKRQIFALDHIQDIALIKQDLATDSQRPATFRIEAYDIAHISGTDVVGVMTVVEDGESNKSQYRKFKIRSDRNDDTNNLKEIIARRLNHPEWPMPDLVVVDGGVGQVNAAKAILAGRGLDIQVVGLVKDERHKAREILGEIDRYVEKQVILANSEAHRFAIKYHRKLRGKGFRI